MAGRATFYNANAKGGGGMGNQGGNRMLAQSMQYSARDLPGHLTLKTRKPGQGTAEELSEADLRMRLLEKEAEHFAKKEGKTKEEKLLELAGKRGIKRSAEEELKAIESRRFEDAEEEDESSSEASSDADADDVSDSESSSSDSDDDDDELELKRELERIRAKKEEERLKRLAEEEAKKHDELASTNPLIGHLAGAGRGSGHGSTFVVKKRWYEDTVFRNQAADEPKVKKRFINDTIRNDFHRKFLSKYIK